MPFVSKEKLNSQFQEKLFQEFISSLTTLGSHSNLATFFVQFLSDTERTMLLKRFTAIFMLHEGISCYRIAKILKISQSTVHRFLDSYYKEEYPIFNLLLKEHSTKKKFWTIIEKVIRAGMPPIAGSGRWEWFYELDKKYTL